MPMVRRSILPMGALLGVLTACGGTPEAATDGPAVADTALVAPEAVAIAGFELAGVAETAWRDAWQMPAHVSLDPGATQPLGSIVEGRVLEVRVFPGDRVRQGDIVAAIHSHEVMDARQALAAAQAGRITADSAATVAEAAAGRAERLLAARALSPAEVERAKAARAAAVAARAAAHAELERAEAMMSHLLGDAPAAGVDEHAALIRAPFDGIVTGREVQPGQVVLVGQPLVTIAREGRLGILMHLPEEAVASVARDVAVRFTVPAYPDRIFRARVMRIAPVVDSLSRAMEVWAAIEGEGQRLLRAEMTANAELEGARGASVLAVPAGAIQVMDGDTVVVVARRVGDGMLLEARAVRLGRRSTDRAEILGGVAVGDSVLDRGAAIGKAELLKRRAARGGAGE
ncbi:MAG: efflux RND transporter periplasmic adaptor subunit [Gemmatimonadaceae bacterium]